MYFFDDATIHDFLSFKIWLPDVEVLNLKMFRSLDVLDKLQGLWVSQNSEVLYVLAARITFICAMSFEAFPLDIQTCLFQVSFLHHCHTQLSNFRPFRGSPLYSTST